jgi:hypothetical protein
MVSLAPWLLTAAMILLLIEILQRRTGLLAFRMRWATNRRVVKTTPTVAPVAVGRAAAPIPPAGKPAPPKTAAPAQAAKPEPVPDENVVDALSQARNRAARRTQR